MTDQMEYSGLCVSCRHARSCTHRLKDARPVIFCEEFSSSDQEKPVETLCHDPMDQEDEATVLKGLCRNCENRITCKLPKPESGIWNCEEYA